MKTEYNEITMHQPALLVRNGRSERKRRVYIKKVCMFLTGANELAEYGNGAHFLLDVISEDAKNPEKIEKKNGTMLEQLLGRD